MDILKIPYTILNKILERETIETQILDFLNNFEIENGVINPNDSSKNIPSLRNNIISQMNRYLPYISIQNLEIDLDDNSMSIKFTYFVNDSSATATFEYVIDDSTSSNI